MRRHRRTRLDREADAAAMARTFQMHEVLLDVGRVRPGFLECRTPPAGDSDDSGQPRLARDSSGASNIACVVAALAWPPGRPRSGRGRMQRDRLPSLSRTTARKPCRPRSREPPRHLSAVLGDRPHRLSEPPFGVPGERAVRPGTARSSPAVQAPADVLAHHAASRRTRSRARPRGSPGCRRRPSRTRSPGRDRSTGMSTHTEAMAR